MSAPWPFQFPATREEYEAGRAAELEARPAALRALEEARCSRRPDVQRVIAAFDRGLVTCAEVEAKLREVLAP